MLCLFCVSSILNPLTWGYSYWAAELDYSSPQVSKLASSKVSGCAHSQRITSLCGQSGVAISAVALVVPSTGSRTSAVLGWGGIKNISFPSLYIKVSWTVTVNCHPEEADACVCCSPQSNENSNLHHTAPEVPKYKVAKVSRNLIGSHPTYRWETSVISDFLLCYYLGWNTDSWHLRKLVKSLWSTPPGMEQSGKGDPLC